MQACLQGPVYIFFRVVKARSASNMWGDEQLHDFVIQEMIDVGTHSFYVYIIEATFCKYGMTRIEWYILRPWPAAGRMIRRFTA